LGASSIISYYNLFEAIVFWCYSFFLSLLAKCASINRICVNNSYLYIALFTRVVYFSKNRPKNYKSENNSSMITELWQAFRKNFYILLSIYVWSSTPKYCRIGPSWGRQASAGGVDDRFRHLPSKVALPFHIHEPKNFNPNFVIFRIPITCTRQTASSFPNTIHLLVVYLSNN
jgi:hypothetical protein